MTRNIIMAASTAALTLALGACTGAGTESGEIPVVDIAGTIAKADFDNLSQMIEIESVFRPEFTDSTMLDTPELLAVANGIAYLNEGEWLSRYDFVTGKSIDAFSHTGEGPEEYSYLWQSAYNPAVDRWSIVDSNRARHSILEYTADGKFVMREEIDSIEYIGALSDGGWLAINCDHSMDGGFHKVTERKLYRFTSDWKPVSVCPLADKRWEILAQGRMEMLLPVDGQLYVTVGDTICRYDESTSTVVKSIILDLGEYSYPWGNLKELEELREVEKNHLAIPRPVFNSSYLFASYAPMGENGRWRFDAYSLTTGELIYRHTSELDRRGGLEQFFTGLPLTIDGETVYGWPMNYVSDDSFFILIPSDEMSRISDDENVNPAIAKCKFKSN